MEGESRVTELRLVVTAADYEEALRFYRDALGLRQLAVFSSPGGRVTLLDAGRATIELADETHAAYVDQVEVGRRVAGHVRVAFEVADSRRATEDLVRAGARLIAEPTETPWKSLNSRLDGPADLQLTLFSDLNEDPARSREAGMLKRTDSADPDFLALARELDAELRETYPLQQDGYDKLNVLPTDVLVALAYVDGRPVACGCLKPLGGASYELKRMFVAKDHRGKGRSKEIVGELEAWAREREALEIVLETGVKQLAAISLYAKCGYERIANYGPYLGNDNSVCMRKRLR